MSKLKYVGIACLAMILSSCEDIIKKYVDTSDIDILSEYVEPEKTGMEVTDITFAPDYKTFTVSTRFVQEGPAFSITDSTRVRTEVTEVIDGIRHTIQSTPLLQKMENVEAEGVKEFDLRMLVLVDRTLPQEQLNDIQWYVREMRTAFDPKSLYIVFMEGDKISKKYPATDYIIDAYFKHMDQPYIYLYRAMQENREKMVNREDEWKGAQRCVMLTFAAERPYDENSDIPYDPDHYKYEEQLVKRPLKDSTFIAYYVDLDPQDTDEEDDVQCVPYIFCSLNGGEYFWDYDWIELKHKIYDKFHFNFPDNRFVFVNPDNKVYRGDRKELTLNIYDKSTDKLVASFTTNVTLGRPFRPIVVNGHNIAYVLMQGVLLGLFIFLLVYFVMQVIIPLVRYVIFRRKYVLRYAGPNMSVNNQTVAESCYLCKAPFQPGDRIVAKCEHTMHEECWESNGYHCPEYSDHCKHGSHYFNKYNLFDVQNASFYMRWVIMAILSAIVAWFVFMIYLQYGVERIMQDSILTGAGQVPFLGLIISFCLTMGLAVLAVAPRSFKAWTDVILRTLIASAVSYFTFFMVDLAVSVLKITILLPLFVAIPWIVSSYIVAICSTQHTRVVYNRRIVILSVIIGVLSMVIWNVFYGFSELDYRVILLFSFLFYNLSMAISVATAAPRSQRYFLKVEGAVKTMDVALYKWFRNHQDKVVTIGKSVDCSLQLSWDVQSNIAPVQAEIRFLHKVPYLIALEPGVLVKNKPLRVNQRVRLLHGKRFSIGNTWFTFIEKDR